MLLDSSEASTETTTNIDHKIRLLFATKAFLWFTVPRIVQQIVKTCQQIMCAGLESSRELLDLYCAHSAGGTAHRCDLSTLSYRFINVIGQYEPPYPLIIPDQPPHLTVRRPI